jgi:predicted transcriptional regulator
MKRTTIFLPESLERELQGLARREGKPVAWFVREALATYVASQRGAARLPSFAAIAEGVDSDVAERHEELLWADPHGHVPDPEPSDSTRAAAGRRPGAAPRRRTPRR